MEEIAFGVPSYQQRVLQVSEVEELEEIAMMRRAAEAVETEKLEQIGLLLLHYVRLMLGVAKVAGAVELVGLEKVESGVPNSDYLMRQAAEFEQ